MPVFFCISSRAMLRIGLTGSIGSGKSTVAKIFEVLGVPVYYADPEARKLMQSDVGLRSAIMANFGEEAYEGSSLNSLFLAEQIFSDPAKLSLLNSLVHPVIIADADAWMKMQVSPYVVKEAALLFESGADKHLDVIIGIDAPENIRLRRVMSRDGVARDKVLERQRNQLGNAEKMRLCNHVIVNDDKQLITPQVLKLHELFLSSGENED